LLPLHLDNPDSLLHRESPIVDSGFPLSEVTGPGKSIASYAKSEKRIAESES
jgi:hypothetical protein